MCPERLYSAFESTLATCRLIVRSLTFATQIPRRLSEPLRTVYRKCLPSGRKWGHRWEPSFSSRLSVVISVLLPPFVFALTL